MVETKTYNFEIKTISPVHIGSGDKYDASEYFLDIHNNKTKVFRRIDIPKYYSSLNKSQQENFINKIQKTGYRFPKIENKKKFTRYLALNVTSSRPSPKYQIMENVKSMNKPYIPGSSIKGAIENVILYNSLESSEIPNLFNGNKINDKFLDSFFSNSGKANDNILRFLQIADSSNATSPVIYDVFSVKPKKKGIGHETVIKTYLETIYSRNTLSSNITTNYDEKFYEDLDIDDKSYMIDMNYIKESIFNFSCEYIDYEIDFCIDHDYDNLLVFYENLKKINSIKKPLLKIGHGSGFLATTISLKIKKFDNIKLFKTVKNNTKIRKEVKKSKKDFPITRKIIKQPLKNNNYREKTMGWCQLIFE